MRICRQWPLRLNEGDQVMQMFAQNMGIRVIRAAAEERFLGALAGEVDPEKNVKLSAASLLKFLLKKLVSSTV